MIQLACAAERNYLAHSAAMLASALRAGAPGGVEIHYFHPPRFPSQGRRRLAGMVEALGGSISFREVGDDLVRELPTRDFTRKATWYRLFLPELLPDLDRVLYVDVDAIVTGSLEPLWATDLGDNYLGAVTNVFQPDHIRRTESLGISPRDYFNAGVLVLNLELMRADGCAEALRDFAARNPGRIDWRDQDTLNLVLGERRLHLHPRWNCMNSIVLFPSSIDVFGAEAVQEARSNPAIRHFEGPGRMKPWHADCDLADRRLYAEQRRHTPWPEVTLEGRGLRNRARRAVERVRYALTASRPV